MRAGIHNGGWVVSGSAGAGQVGLSDTANTSGANANHTHGVTAAGTNSAPAITVAAGDAETRPVNANVNYIIKI
jgi:hypothetical protein